MNSAAVPCMHSKTTGIIVYNTFIDPQLFEGTIIARFLDLKQLSIESPFGIYNNCS
jgi:hypothetical protein